MILDLTSYRKNKCIHFFQKNVNTIVRIKLTCEFERNLHNISTFKNANLTDPLWDSLLLINGIFNCSKNYGKLYNKLLINLNRDDFQKFREEVFLVLNSNLKIDKKQMTTLKKHFVQKSETNAKPHLDQLSMLKNCIQQIDKKLHTHNKLLFTFDDTLVASGHKIAFYWSLVFELGEFQTLKKWLSDSSRNSLNPDTYNNNREIVIHTISFYFPEKNQQLISAKYDTIQDYVIKKNVISLKTSQNKQPINSLNFYKH